MWPFPPSVISRATWGTRARSRGSAASTLWPPIWGCFAPHPPDELLGNWIAIPSVDEYAASLRSVGGRASD
eukprot:9859973-Lingulodinium_polyedra.AAC.1